MTELVFREARESDAEALAPRLRKADLSELRAAHGRWCDPLAILRSAIRRSDLCWAAEEGDIVCMLFGVAGLSLLSEHGPVGSPWMLGADELYHHGKTLVRQGREYVRLMHERYPYLVNHVDAHNTASKRWLRRIGFVVYPPAPYGPELKPFHRFDKLKEPADV